MAILRRGRTGRHRRAVLDLGERSAMIQLLVERDECDLMQGQVASFSDSFHLRENDRAVLADRLSTGARIAQHIGARGRLVIEGLKDLLFEKSSDFLLELLPIDSPALLRLADNDGHGVFSNDWLVLRC